MGRTPRTAMAGARRAGGMLLAAALLCAGLPAIAQAPSPAQRIAELEALLRDAERRAALAAVAEEARQRSEDAATNRRAETLDLLDRRLGGTERDMVVLLNTAARDGRLQRAPDGTLAPRSDAHRARACIVEGAGGDRGFVRHALDRQAALLPRAAEGGRAGVQLCSWSDDVRLFDLILVTRLRGVPTSGLNLAQFHELALQDALLPVARVTPGEWQSTAAVQRAQEEAATAARRAAQQAEAEQRLAAARAAREAEAERLAREREAEAAAARVAAARRQAEIERNAAEAMRQAAERIRAARQADLGFDCPAADAQRRLLCALYDNAPHEAETAVAALDASARQAWLPLLVLLRIQAGQPEEALRLLPTMDDRATRSLLARVVLGDAERFADPDAAREALAMVEPEADGASAAVAVALAYDPSRAPEKIALLLPAVSNPAARGSLAATMAFAFVLDRRCDEAAQAMAQIGAGALRDTLALLPRHGC